MVPIIERPSSVEEYDYVLLDLDEYPIDEQIEYWKKKARSVKFMHDKHPDAFSTFISLYGQDVANEIMALA